MRILQIIDSLEIGGAEKMAVNYANALCDKMEFSGLVATRKEGNLKRHVNKKVNYLFLNRKKTFDIKALLILRAYCVQHKIQYLHAHSSSFFMAFLIKISMPSIQILWHDHNGLSDFVSRRETFALKTASFFFKGIIVVNYQLKDWAVKELHCKNVINLANYTTLDLNEIKETTLLGAEGKRILCLANLRLQKNHFLLLEVAKKLKLSHPDWSFHLVGKDFNDDYAAKINSEIISNDLQNNVLLYGLKNDSNNILNQSEIAILTSQSEGLPVALIEYGLSKKAVVSTNVGEIPLIIKHGANGFLISKFDSEAFYDSLVTLIENTALRIQFGEELYKTVCKNNAEKEVIQFYLNWLKAI